MLYGLAEAHGGYVTTAEADAAGVSRQQLSYLARTGSIERVAHGIYRFRRFPAQPFEDVIVACLWAGADAAASHETALTVYELGDAMPARIHVTVPRRFRGRRPGVILHVADLDDEERTFREAVPVTTVARAITDVLESSGPGLAVQAAAEGLERGLITRRGLQRSLSKLDDEHRPLLSALLHRPRRPAAASSPAPAWATKDADAALLRDVTAGGPGVRADTARHQRGSRRLKAD